MKERDLIMRKRAEDRLEKSRQLAEAAEKLKKEEAALQEKLALKRIEQACQSGGAEESWEQRLEREKAVREERKLKHKAAILAQRVPLTASIEESINIFKDIKGKNAPEPPKIKIEPIKAVDPETVMNVPHT